MSISLYDRVRSFISAGQASDLYACSWDIETNGAAAKEYENGIQKGIIDLLTKKDIKTLNIIYRSPLKDGLSALWIDQAIEKFTSESLFIPKKENIRYLLGLPERLSCGKDSINNGINQAFRTAINLGDRGNARDLATSVLMEGGLASFIDLVSRNRAPGNDSTLAFTQSELALSAAFYAALCHMHAQQKTELISDVTIKSLKDSSVWFCLAESAKLIEHLEEYLSSELRTELVKARTHSALKGIFQQDYEILTRSPPRFTAYKHQLN